MTSLILAAFLLAGVLFCLSDQGCRLSSNYVLSSSSVVVGGARLSELTTVLFSLKHRHMNQSPVRCKEVKGPYKVCDTVDELRPSDRLMQCRRCHRPARY